MCAENRIILEEFKKNRDQGLKSLFNRYYRPLVIFADDYLSDIDKSCDIVQSFFIRLYERDYLFKIAPDALSSYLFTSVRRECLAEINKNDILSKTVDIAKIDMANEVSDTLDDNYIIYIKNQVDKLPNRTKEALEYVVFQDLKYNEVASLMGISVNTVKYLIKEAFRKLRQDIKNPIIFIISLFKKKK